MDARIYFHDTSSDTVKTIFGCVATPYGDEIRTALIDPSLLGRLDGKSKYNGQLVRGDFAYWREGGDNDILLPKIEAVHPVHGRMYFTTYSHPALITYGIPTVEERNRRQGIASVRVEIDPENPIASAFDIYESMYQSNPPLLVCKLPRVIRLEKERGFAQ